MGREKKEKKWYGLLFGPNVFTVSKKLQIQRKFNQYRQFRSRLSREVEIQA